ncbi:MAG: Type 1 glutamine amidotransferase-like domain-containing protein [Ilumatobacter sp.]|uniref:Type 1 glutamine amidotransferase-like domain-containing protein n=1 Tax=Ilumatobacter sp. TaxID=1967498 RepID=UPI002613EC92|nr:Type 1 glutamine amidotransferase-like domain-containing protein [Ilumatobacter sp.]MDJ0770423.1 Type 1 glutamine amidotransferase-like domain-containing protein [Ilumatobacter sp.]
MTGTLVLQGGGPFVANDDLDQRVMSGIDRIVVLPTADAYEQPARMIEAATAWGERLGIQVDALMVLVRSDADEAAAATVAGAPAVFLAGDSSSHLRSVLKDTPLFDALTGVLERGGVLVAAGASAAALCDPMTDSRGGGFTIGLGLVDGLAVITDAETWPTDQIERTHHLADTTVVDLPTGSALVRTGDGWEVVGDAAVHGDLPT